MSQISSLSVIPDPRSGIQGFCLFFVSKKESLWILAFARMTEREREARGVSPPHCEGEECGVSPPHGEILLFRQKDPKPWAPRRGPSGAFASVPKFRAAELAALKQSSPPNKIRDWGVAAPAGALRWRHVMAQLQISATSALSAIVVAPSHAACRGRPETDSVMRWRGYKEGGPHEMRPLQLKIQARRWIPDQVRDDRGGQTDSSFASLRTSALLRMTRLVFCAG